MLRTHFSSSAMSVSSSQGFTSRRRLLLAMRAGSENRLDQIKSIFNSSCEFLILFYAVGRYFVYFIEELVFLISL